MLLSDTLIVFDRDGTLLDFSNMFLRFILDLYLNEGIDPPDTRTILSLNYWRNIVEADLMIGEILVREHLDDVPRRYISHACLYKGVVKTVRLLRRSGAQLAIVSGWVGTSETVDFLKARKIGRHFSRVVTCDDLPANFRADALHTGYSATKLELLRDVTSSSRVDNLIVVGDSPEDILVGKQMGAMTIAVLTGNGTPSRHALENLKPDLILDSVASMAELLTGDTVSRGLTRAVD